MKYVSSLKNLAGKSVLLRADLDAPHDGVKILDESRIRAAVPTIEYLYKAGAKIIIVSKSGKPKGKDNSETLQPNAQLLADLLGKKLVVAESKMPDYDINHFIFFTADMTDDKNIVAVKSVPAKDIVLLENIRFYPQETEPDLNFAKLLASMADIYVNDAFAMMHRNEASVSLIPEYLPSYAGLNVEKEIAALNKLLTLQASPFTVIMGGAKISDKVGAIRNLGKKADHILVGGGPANLFFLAKGIDVGKSLCEKENVGMAEELLRNFKDKIVLPVDVVVADAETLANIRVCKPGEIKSNEAMLDIGPQTILLFSQYIKESQKMVWNGPMGLFEKPPFSHGTMSMALIFASRCKGQAYGVVGGGDTLEAVNQAKISDQIDFVSTAGSAILDYLAGDTLPGLKALELSIKN